MPNWVGPDEGLASDLYGFENVGSYSKGKQVKIPVLGTYLVFLRQRSFKNEPLDAGANPLRSYLFFLTSHKCKIKCRLPRNQIGWRSGKKAGKASYFSRRRVCLRRSLKKEGRELSASKSYS